MKIKGIKLQDFRIFEREEILFDQPFSLLLGKNHQGKSSIAQAIKLALSKCADGTDPRGAGALDKVRLGANKAIIETVIEGKQGLVTLTTQYGPGKTGRNQKIVTDPVNEKVAEGFDHYLDANQERLSCVLDSNYFVSQKPEQQKAILATLVLPTHYDFDLEMVALAEKQLGKFEWGKSPVAVIDQVYDAAYRARREAKAALGAIRVPATPQKPQHSAEDVQAKLAKLRTAAAKESKAVSGGGTVQVGRLEQLTEQARESFRAAQEELTTAEQQRDALDTQVIAGDELTEVQRLASGRKLHDQLQSKIDAATGEIAQQKEAQAIYAELLQDEKGNPVDHANCPTCTQSITRAFIDGKISEHKKLEKEAGKATAGLIAERQELGDIAEAEQKLAANAKRISEAIALAKKIGELKLKLQEIKTTGQGLADQLKEAKAQETTPADTTKLDALNAKIAEVEGLLSPALNYESTLDQIKRATDQWVAQKDTVSDLEVLCEHFGKDGIKAELIAKHIGEFSDTVNGVLSAWGYSAKLEIEPYSFLVTTPTGELPLKEISGSESMFFAVALQTAIAVHGRIKMVVVDRADTLVEHERGRLFGCLKKLLDSGTLEQAIVFASDPGRTKINKPGVATYWVEAGKVEQL
jgi:DNA repair exonuclease SbcCD ATPase subunit